MAETFGLYIARNSRIHQLHPLTKLVMAGFFLVAGLGLPGLWTTYALFLLGLIPVAVLSQVFFELISRVWKITLPFAISVFLIQGFLWTGGTRLLEFGPLSLKREGLIFAAASTGRILIVVGSFLWFALTSRPDLLMTALSQHGLPASLSYLIVSSIQIVPRFQARAATILDAQRARGLETSGSLLQRARAIFPLVAPMILSSLVDVEERALAIEARAFNYPGKKTSLLIIDQAPWESAFRWLLAIAMVGSIILRVLLR